MNRLSIAALAAMLMPAPTAAAVTITLVSPTTTLSHISGFYTGITNIDCRIRLSGIGDAQRVVTLTMQLSDFSPNDGPRITHPGEGGLYYHCTPRILSQTHRNCGLFPQRATTLAQHNLIRWTPTPGEPLWAGCHTAINWSIANLMSYRTGSYTATVTFTLTAF